MVRIREHKNVTFDVFDSHIMASKDNQLIMMEKRANFSVWRIQEKTFVGNLLTVWKIEPDCLPEIAWIAIEDAHGTKLARTYN